MCDLESGEEKFWIVWCPQSSIPPRVQHGLLSDAKEEAKRLAHKSPLHDFYVLRAVGVARTTAVTYTDIQPTRADR